MRRMTRVFTSSVSTSLLLMACPLMGQQLRELPAPAGELPIRLAVVEIVGKDVGGREVEAPKQLLLRQTSELPIGTGIKPELQTRMHVGDQPNLMPQLRQAASPMPLAAKPLEQPVPLRDPETASPIQLEIHAAPSVEIKRQTIIAPRLSVEVEGPACLIADQESAYLLQVKNEGDSTAQGVVLDIAFSRDVTITQTNRAPEISRSIYRFVLDDVKAGESSTLKLKLLAKKSGEINLATRLSLSTQANWSLNITEAAKPASLHLKLDGLERVNVGEAADQKITVSNPGVMAIEDVELRVRVPDHLRVTGNQEPTMKVGTLAAGASRTFVLKSVATRAADQPLEVSVEVGGQNVHQQQKSIVVDEKQVALAIMGPTTVEPGTPATFGVELSNLSEGSTLPLAVQLLLPADMQVLTLDRAASFDAKRNLLVWQLNPMDANQRLVLRVKAVSEKVGNVILRAQVNSADEVLMQKQFALHVADESTDPDTSRR